MQFYPFISYTIELVNSYTMDCPPVRGDNPRALASGLPSIQAKKHMVYLFHTILIIVNHVRCEIFLAKAVFGKNGIIIYY